MTPVRIARLESRSLLLQAAVAVAGLYFLREFLIPLAFAWTLTLLLSPVAAWLERLRFPRLAAVTAAMLLTLAPLGLAGWSIGNQMLDAINSLPAYRHNIRAKLQRLRHSSEGALGRAAENVKQLGQELANAPPPPRARMTPRASPDPEGETNLLDAARRISESLLGPVAVTGIVLVFTMFMMVDREDFRNRLLRLSGTGRLAAATRALDEATTRVSRYLGLLFGVNVAFGLLIAAGLHWIGLPNPVLWGALAGFLRVIPYIGGVVAAAFPAFLAFAVFDGWLQPALVLALFFALELLTGNVLEPLLYGAHTGISSLALLVAAVFWTVIWGPAGLVLSTPLTVCLAVLGRHVPGLGFLHILLGDEPTLTPAEQLYQRILALDEREARHIVDSTRLEGGPAATFDQVMIPALQLAENDRRRDILDASQEEMLFSLLRELVIAREAGASAPVPNRSGRVILIPAGSEADEAAAEMISAVLENEGYRTEALASGVPLAESLAGVDALTAADSICVSALAPASARHLNAVRRSLRKLAPETRAVIAIWGQDNSVDPAALRTETPVTRLTDWLPSLATAHPLTVEEGVQAH